ncbi:hypothetical protein PtB15_14B296 [Puccinia triticina]|nr:hypothetical protein PtB15_14B296 [Puccinia triticina]
MASPQPQRQKGAIHGRYGGASSGRPWGGFQRLPCRRPAGAPGRPAKGASEGVVGRPLGGRWSGCLADGTLASGLVGSPREIDLMAA